MRRSGVRLPKAAPQVTSRFFARPDDRQRRGAVRVAVVPLTLPQRSSMRAAAPHLVSDVRVGLSRADVGVPRMDPRGCHHGDGWPGRTSESARYRSRRRRRPRRSAGAPRAPCNQRRGDMEPVHARYPRRSRRSMAPEWQPVRRPAAVVSLPAVGPVRVPVARLLRLVLDGRRPAAHLDGVVAASVLRYVRAGGWPARRGCRGCCRCGCVGRHAVEAAGGQGRPAGSCSRSPVRARAGRVALHRGTGCRGRRCSARSWSMARSS